MGVSSPNKKYFFDFCPMSSRLEPHGLLLHGYVYAADGLRDGRIEALLVFLPPNPKGVGGKLSNPKK